MVSAGLQYHPPRFRVVVGSQGRQLQFSTVPGEWHNLPAVVSWTYEEQPGDLACVMVRMHTDTRGVPVLLERDL